MRTQWFVLRIKRLMFIDLNQHFLTVSKILSHAFDTPVGT
jgi:hypothetical protein